MMSLFRPGHFIDQIEYFEMSPFFLRHPLCWRTKRIRINNRYYQVDVEKKEDKTKSRIEAIASNITLCQLDRVVNCWIVDHLLTLIFPNSRDAFRSKKDSINNKWKWNVANYHLNHYIYIWNFSIKAMFWSSLKTYWQVI